MNSPNSGSCLWSCMVLPVSSWAAHSRHTDFFTLLAIAHVAFVVALKADHRHAHHRHAHQSQAHHLHASTCGSPQIQPRVPYSSFGVRRAPGTRSESRGFSHRLGTHSCSSDSLSQCGSSPPQNRRPVCSCSKRQPYILCRCAGQWQCTSDDCSSLGNSCRCTWPTICSCGRADC